MANIPVIDLAQPDRESLVRSVAAAAAEWGFFQAVNHGVPSEVIAELHAVGSEFFRLPQPEKEALAAPAAGPGAGLEGYGTKLNARSWGEHLFHKVWPPSQVDYKSWPGKPERYRAASEEYARRVREGAAEKLWECLSLGLGLAREALKESVGGDAIVHVMKVNYYPASPEHAVGVPSHTDMSGLTILVADRVDGLEILKDDQWLPVRCIPDALVVHIGDQIQIASNGIYKSVIHRSRVDNEKTRMSWPLFLEPPPEFVVGPIPEILQNNKTAPKYRPMSFKDYAFAKLNPAK